MVNSNFPIVTALHVESVTSISSRNFAEPIHLCLVNQGASSPIEKFACSSQFERR